VARSEHVTIEVAGHEVRLSNPKKVYFPQAGFTKHDLVNYYLAAADAVLVHVRDRPTVMKRFVNGIEQEPIWQKRVPQKIPDWLQTVTLFVPTRWAVDGLEAMTWRGQGFSAALAPVGAMLAFSAAFAALAIWKFDWEE